MVSCSYPSLSAALSALSGEFPWKKKPVGGGCINRTSLISIANGECFFLKENHSRLLEMFEKEASGLDALRREPVEGLHIPCPLAAGVEGTASFLLLEYVPPGRGDRQFWEKFGSALAKFHRQHRSPMAGFEHDNYLGTTPQINHWSSSWPAFFQEHRLGYQTRKAKEEGWIDRALMLKLENVGKRVEELFPSEEPSLLHGDLWGGNFMISSSGQAVLIDPAVYYGSREADLAMTELFGGFDARFYEAYQQEWPLLAGYRERRDLYNLYHLLNHLNLFGSSYLGQVRSIAHHYG